MVSPQFVAETLVALERLGAQPTLNIFDGTISLAGRLPALAAGAPRLEAAALAGAAGVARRGRSATIDVEDNLWRLAGCKTLALMTNADAAV